MGELHLHALLEPDVSLSTHPALVIPLPYGTIPADQWANNPGAALMVPESLVFLLGPSHQPPVEGAEGLRQRAGVVPTEVGEPASDFRIEHPGQILQRFVAHTAAVPSPDFGHDGLLAFALIAGRKLQNRSPRLFMAERGPNP